MSMSGRPPEDAEPDEGRDVLPAGAQNAGGNADRNDGKPAVAYRIDLLDSLAEVAPEQWDRLARPAGMIASHAFLHGLETTGCVGPGTGWTPRHLLLWRGARDGGEDTLAGAVPLYLKDHSYGEYVFDWAWAEAYERHGLAYYPKWLSAIPFTPIGGPRLLAADDDARRALAQALLELARQSRLSSLHVLLPDDADAAALADAGCMLRQGVQFHWRNDGWRSFDDFLASLSQPKRKKIRAERRKVRDAGVRVTVRAGADIAPEHWDFFDACYRNTYREHHGTPYLSRAFFSHLAARMPAHCVMALAENDAGRLIAASLLWRDEAGGASRLYGRYWGALRHVPCLHFELAYYAPIEWAIGQGIQIIEGGAQGEHKLARGFLPEATRSAHWLAHPAFAHAVEDFLARERPGMDAYLDELREHSPFRESP